MRITVKDLVTFDREYGDGDGYRYSAQSGRNGDRRVYMLRDTLVYSTRHALAYLYGRFSELHARGEVRELSPEWGSTTREVYASDTRAWFEYEKKGGESV